ncbi:hypothetical protein ACFL6M_05735 [Candidatus Eisenbacteria bacterium]|uniref:Uncharacterized protein n=1 Tax=Eiseniibacteriota bacterium TaxID=2212470 RepID=A0ABV6YL80_UNCEI
MAGRRSVLALLGVVLLGALVPSASYAGVPKVVLAEDFGYIS